MKGVEKMFLKIITIGGLIILLRIILSTTVKLKKLYNKFKEKKKNHESFIRILKEIENI